MSRVSMAMRKHYLHQELANLNAMARDISRKFMELHRYAAAVARGRMTLLDMAGMPGSAKLLASSFVLGYHNQVVPSALDKSAKLWATDNSKNDPKVYAFNMDLFKNRIASMHDNPNYEEQLLNKCNGNKEQWVQERMNDDYKNNMYQQALEAEEKEFRKQKEAEIKVIEDDLQQQQLMNNSRMEAVKQELANVEKAEPETIKRSMGTYA